jgi:hypothetical protein
MHKEEIKDWLRVAEDLYRHMNPNSKMDVPSSAYEIVSKWRNEWAVSETDLDLFNWCLKNKSGK